MTTSSNLELVGSIYAAWGRGDWTADGWAHQDVELVFTDGPDPGTWRGLAAVADAMREQLRAWQGYRSEAEEYRELDDGRILALYKRKARGRRSGLQIQGKGASVFQIRDGKVSRMTVYWDRDHALADLGLGQDPASPHS